MFDVIYHLISSEHESTPFTEISIEEEDSERILEISKREDLMSLIQVLLHHLFSLPAY
ncbi:MAG: hypothetical protein Ct9H90mP21_0390 [Methanobacteriota archaeon]|nr:MAG: hypothetical protein Ct9H90mP21_0390 [Euryarchaeota archaeon]